MTRRFPCMGPPLSPAARLVLVTTPPVLLGSTLLLYRWLAAHYGIKWGYFGGFLIYWLGWCTAVPLWTLGARRARALFGDAPSGRRPTHVDLVALALPPLLGYTTAFPRAVRQASPRIVFASAALALVNATAEELLWRGAFVAAFPRHRVASWLYSAAGFAAWHLAPQSLVPNRFPGGATSFVAVSGIFGLLWGAVAARTGSIRWTIVSHALTDFAGLGARIYLAHADPRGPRAAADYRTPESL
jgi:membrane protease YdiL (CAAX protease family)